MRILIKRLALCCAIGATFAGAAVDAQPPEGVQHALRNSIFKLVTAVKAEEDIGGALGQIASMAGREDLTVEAAVHRRVCVAIADDPVRHIVERARATNVVIINESHHSSFERHFIGKLLRALAVEGYSIYAAETFSTGVNFESDDVLGSYGFYSNEPTFGRTVKLAKFLGYKLVAYEQTADQDAALALAQPSLSRINRRESNQTENLMKAIFTKEPHAKVLIHVGDAHAWERKSSGTTSDSVWMAERLKIATGSDPLTISQMDCVSSTQDSVIAETGEANPPVDLYIGHPPPTFRDGRPAWRQEAGDRPTAVPAQFLSLNERVMVEARLDGASLGTVPIDRLLLFPGEKLPLLLPPGRYRVDGFLPAGRIEAAPAIVDVK